MLQTFGCFGINGELDRYAFLTISFLTVKDDNTTFLGLADVHDAEVEAIGGKAQVVADTYRELAHQGFFNFSLFTFTFSLL